MRLFIAIRVDGALRDALLSAQRALAERGVRGRYTPAENLHLTLAFLGELPDAQPALDALAELSFAPFPLTLEGLGCFDELWWAGVSASGALTELACRLRRLLAERGIPYERTGFIPHITLLRRAEGAVPFVPVEPASMQVGEITLFRSDQGKDGMRYTALGRLEAQEKQQKKES